MDSRIGINMIFKKEEQIIVAEKVKEDVIHTISVVGMERADFVYFLAKLLEQYFDESGYRSVLLIDNSYTKDLFGIFNQHDADTDVFKRNRVTVVQDVCTSPEYFDKFSYVIMYHGFDVDQEFLSNSDLVIVQTDYIPSTYRQLKGIFNDCENVHIIFRDWQSKKVKESMIESEMGIENARIQMRSIIKANAADNLAYFNLCHNGTQKITKANLSDLYMETLRYFTEKITGADEKTVQKIFKKGGKTL